MLTRVAAVAACLAILAAPAHAGGPFTLDDAMARVVASHPELRAFEPLRAVRGAERDAAALPPPLVAGANLENAFGSGEARLLTGMEFSLTLASVLEQDDKRPAREAVAARRLTALDNRRKVVRLDLLAETARRYLALVQSRELVALGAADVEQRERAVQGSRQRVQAGAAPESELLAAQAAHARAKLMLARAQQQRLSGWRHLAALWGERGEPDPARTVADVNPRQLPEIPALSVLTDLLARTPDLAVFADEQRIREARLQLARTAETADLAWQVGVRRLEATDDVALVGSVSMPLGARRYAAPGIEAARAELVAIDIEREARGQALHATLVEAHGRYTTAHAEALAFQREVLPLLARAERAAGRAYRAGAIRFLDWAQLQSEYVEASRQLLDRACDAQRALIEIQRLTGEAFVVAAVPPPTATAVQGDSK